MKVSGMPGGIANLGVVFETPARSRLFAPKCACRECRVPVREAQQKSRLLR